jgi:hypothetical protein
LAFVGFLWPEVAFAAGAKAVALFIEGGDADSVAAEVQAVLPPELSVVDAKTFASAMKKAGQGSLGNAIAVNGAARDKMFGRIKKAMEAVQADAAIVGRVRIGKQGKEVWLVWVTSDGEARVDQSVSLKGDSADRKTAFHAALDAPASALVPAATVAPPDSGGPDPSKPPVVEDPDKDKPKSNRTPHVYGTSLFGLSVAFEMGARHMAFTDAVTANIRPYDVFGAPMIAASGELYPAATTGITVLKNIGLAARFSMALGLGSKTKTGPSVTNTWLRFRGGLKWRFVPGSETGPVLALTGDFGMDGFSFDNAGDLAGEVPTVQYQYLRAGGEVRLPIGPIAFSFGGGYRGLIGLGETGQRFTGANALAFDGEVGFSAALPAGFEIRLSGDYTRVFYAFAPLPGDAYVAGGAVDEMLGARLGVAYVY